MYSSHSVAERYTSTPRGSSLLSNTSGPLYWAYQDHAPKDWNLSPVMNSNLYSITPIYILSGFKFLVLPLATTAANHVDAHHDNQHKEKPHRSVRVGWRKRRLDIRGFCALHNRQPFVVVILEKQASSATVNQQERPLLIYSSSRLPLSSESASISSSPLLTIFTVTCGLSPGCLATFWIVSTTS